MKDSKLKQAKNQRTNEKSLKIYKKEKISVTVEKTNEMVFKKVGQKKREN